LQGLFFALFSQVSSSGGGLPGRLDLIEIEALVILGPFQGKLSFPNRSEESGFMLMLAGNQDPHFVRDAKFCAGRHLVLIRCADFLKNSIQSAAPDVSFTSHLIQVVPGS
jgi:hypothetical protein